MTLFWSKVVWQKLSNPAIDVFNRFYQTSEWCIVYKRIPPYGIQLFLYEKKEPRCPVTNFKSTLGRSRISLIYFSNSCLHFQNIVNWIKYNLEHVLILKEKKSDNYKSMRKSQDAAGYYAKKNGNREHPAGRISNQISRNPTRRNKNEPKTILQILA